MGDIMVQLLSGPFNAIPVIDDISKFAARKALGKKAYKVFSTPMLDDVETAVQKLGKTEVTFMDYLEALGTAGEVTAGLPVHTALRYYKLLTGDKKQATGSGAIKRKGSGTIKRKGSGTIKRKGSGTIRRK
jgi:hypothetical protein